MLSDNIRKYRKSKQMSQDELAEKLQVTRQSISLWETGQTQPTLDNMIELAKLFNISIDVLLTDDNHESVDTDVTVLPACKPKRKTFIITTCLVIISVLITIAVLLISGTFGFGQRNKLGDDMVVENGVSSNLHNTDEKNESSPAINEVIGTNDENQNTVPETEHEKLSQQEEKTQIVENDANSNIDNTQSSVLETEQENSSQQEEKTHVIANDASSNMDNNQSTVPETEQENSPQQEEKTQVVENDANSNIENTQSSVLETEQGNSPQQEEIQSDANETNDNENKNQITASENTESVDKVSGVAIEKDLYSYLKKYVIENGIVNGDYCYYSKSADNYGGYSSENFALYYWADTEKIYFSLHSVLDDVFSISFYIYVPKQHTGFYDYTSSYYYRDTGESIYEASGVINAKEFTKKSPINCTKYYGSTEVQNSFMEMSRQGICDLIDCIKNFMVAEHLEYSFSDFGFTDF